MTQARNSHPLVVENLYKGFADGEDRVRAVDGVSFEVQEGRFYTLLGPSGCGKTTTLRCVAGLERPADGSIRVGEQVLNSAGADVFVPPHKRDIGMVFQSYGIWPHMSVFENVAFPLRVGKPRLSKARVSDRVEQALATVELAGLEERSATALSGGQQQRLALARALVRRPKLLLLDEPLSNLDAKLRDAMRAEVRDLQRRLGITTLYVTHDQMEALSMSDRIAVMANGKIIQEGNALDIYQRPVNRFVAEFVGQTNFVEMVVSGPAGGGRMRLDGPIDGFEAHCPPNCGVGDRVTGSVRPEDVVVSRADREVATNSFGASVLKVMFLGEALECDLRVGAAELTVRTHASLELRHEEQVWVELPPERCTVVSEAYGVASRSASALVAETAADELATAESVSRG